MILKRPLKWPKAYLMEKEGEGDEEGKKEGGGRGGRGDPTLGAGQMNQLINGVQI